MKRRKLIKQAPPGPRRDYYKELGLRTYINAAGILMQPEPTPP